MRRLLGNDPQQEAAVQGILLDRLEALFSRRIRREIARASEQMIAEFERTGSAPLDQFEHLREMTDIFADLARASIDIFGGRILDQGKSAGLALETKDWKEFFEYMAETFIQLEAIRQRITSITDTTRERIVSRIDAGYAEGLGVDAIARSIRKDVPTMSQLRAHVIARTETHGAANYGANEAAKATGLPLRKEWVSVSDHRTRDFGESDGDVDEYNHRGMNGQTVEMDQPFEMPWRYGDPLKIMYPGEAGHPGSATIMCRCAVAHVVDDSRLFGDFETPSPKLPIAPVATPSIDARPVFEYEKYQGIKNAAEAEAYILKHGISKVAALHGISAKGLSGAVGAAHEVTERFGLAPLDFMGPFSRDKRYRYRKTPNANAAVAHTTKAMHLPTKFGDLSDADRQIVAKTIDAPNYRASLNAAFDAGTGISDEVRLLAQRLGDVDYTWSITMDTPELERIKTVYHEYGHVIHLIDDRIGPKIEAFLAEYKPRSGGWNYLLSEYSNANDKEYVAEAFAVYMAKGEDHHYRIHPELLKIFKEFDRK